MSVEKNITYSFTNTYSTLNELTPKTKYVWFVCHGLGYLSRYFIKYFSVLNSEEHYIIAPQASSKQYLNGKFKHVGASWLTKENTQADMENVHANLNAIWEAEQIPHDKKVIVMGFSQGVSVASRWLARKKNNCEVLVLYAGKMPREFKPEDFSQIKNVKAFIGNNDKYINEDIITAEKEYLTSLFSNNIDFTVFDGTHEVKPEIINRITKSI